MAYYYVKNTGTATGDGGRYASQQTGTFAGLGATTTFYSNIDAAEAATTTPVAGDFILSSDLSVHSGAVNISLTIAGVIYMSVDDANIDASRTSGNRASEENTGAADITFTGAFVSGMGFISADNNVFTGQNRLEDCELTATLNADIAVFMSGEGGGLDLLNTTLNANHAGAIVFSVTGGSSVRMSGGAILTTSAGISNMLGGGFTNGGGSMYFSGVDMSGVTGTLFLNIGGDEVNDDAIDIRLDGCKLASGVAFTNEDFKSKNQRLIITRSSFTSSTAEYQYHAHAFGGDVNQEIVIFRNEDTAFTESNQKVSYKIETNADASTLAPLWFDFPVNRYAALSSASTDLLRFYITSSAALTDKDIYINVSYPDGTNKQAPNSAISTAAVTVGGTLDLLATGTTLTTDAVSTWAGGLGGNLYQIDVDTSVDAGADCIPTVTVYVAKASETIYIASEYGLS